MFIALSFLEEPLRALDVGSRGRVRVVPGRPAGAEAALVQRIAARALDDQGDRPDDERVDDADDHERLRLAERGGDREPALVEPAPGGTGVAHRASRSRARTSAMRPAALPSQRSGTRPRAP